MYCRPPRLAERLLRWCLRSAPAADYIVGDLRQEFAGLRSRRGALIASLWYWRQAISVGARYLGRPEPLGPEPARAGASDSGGSLWRQMVDDLLGALRVFRTSRGYAAAVVLTLALGIGVNATMFGAVDRVLSPPDHVQDHEDLRFLTLSGLGARSLNASMSYSFPDYLSIRDLPVLQTAAAYQPRQRITMGVGNEARRVIVQTAGAELFPLLGVAPAVGRVFDAEDDRAGAPPVAVLGHGFWEREFGEDPDAIGRTVTLGHYQYEVVGIAPRGFTGANLEAVDVWVPLRMNVALTANWDVLGSRGARWFRVIVRMAPGVSDREAEAQMTAAHMAGINAALEAGEDLSVEERGGTVHLGAFIAALGPTADGDTANTLWLAGVSILVLLIASANVANLMLARGIERQRDRAVRLAFGLNRRRLLFQAWGEALVLAAMGGIAAIIVAGWSTRALYGLLLPGIPLPDSAVDGRLVGFLGLVVGATAVVAGTIPALHALRTAPAEALRKGSRGTARGGERARSLLTVGQVGLSTVLLVAAGLFVQSFRNALETDFGFDHASLINVGFEVGPGVDGERLNTLYGEALEVLEDLPGVDRAVVSSDSRPLYGWNEMHDLVASRTDSVRQAPQGGPYWYSGSEGFVEAAGLRVVRGRAFEPAEYVVGGPPALMVSESFAEGVWPGLDPLKECVRLREGTLASNASEPCRPVVGVYQDVKTSITDRSSWSITWPIDHRNSRLRGILVRASGDPMELSQSIRERMATLSTEIRFVTAIPMPERIDGMRGQWRVGATLFSLFGALALLVAALGIYSALAFAVARQRREIGIRAALGAQGRDLVTMVVKRAASLIGAGLLSGIGVALLGGRFMESVLFGVPSANPGVFGIVAVVLISAGLSAAWVPARKATAIDPAGAMGAE